MGIDTSFIEWDGGAMGYLLTEDWDVLEKLIDDHGLKSVLEFGSGISTRLFHAKGLEVVSYEQTDKFAQKVQRDCPRAKIRLWNGRPAPVSSLDVRPWDLVFIDGPWCKEDGDDPWFVDRRYAFALARTLDMKFVAVHDTDREREQELITEHFGTWEKVAWARVLQVFRNPSWK